MPNPRDRFSSCCGKPFTQTESWPRVCTLCGNPFWANAIPVAVVLRPVIRKDGKIGIALIRRSINPCIGELALPGGYQEIEHWRRAGSRELREEGVDDIREDNLTPFRPYPFESSTTNDKLMIFMIADLIREEDLQPFVPNTETSERVIVYEPTPCCFYTHTEALRLFFNTYLHTSRQLPTQSV